MTAQQSSLFDGPGRVHRDAHDTEIAAAEAFPEIKGEQRLAVLRAFVDAGAAGLTDYECHLVCGMHRPHIAGTRREELMAAGVPIVKTDQRRPTDTGAAAIVWALNASVTAPAMAQLFPRPVPGLRRTRREKRLREEGNG